MIPNTKSTPMRHPIIKPIKSFQSTSSFLHTLIMTTDRTTPIIHVRQNFNVFFTFAPSNTGCLLRYNIQSIFLLR